MRNTLWAILALFVSVGALALSACGSDDSSDAADASLSSDSASTTEADRPTPQVVLTIDGPDDESSVRRSKVLVHGTVEPADADVEINSRPAVVRDGVWRVNARNLTRGSNELTVRATADGHEDAEDSLTVIRKRSRAEIAAARRARALRKQQAEANFRAGAKRIDYAQLVKNPEKFDGERVVYTGKIMQIREEGSSGGFLLMHVTCDEYGFCDDLIYVDFARSISSAEDDSLTIYGTITGGYEYETAAGGSNFVPRMKARYIDE